MPTIQLFSKLWGNQQEATEERAESAFVDAPATHSRAVGSRRPDPLFALLSHDDIYLAAGILRPRSGYDIDKIIEMLHGERMLGLPEEIKRSSVLMAIEASGSSTDDLRENAAQRQRALGAYEARQCEQLAEFEARKQRENEQSEAEMARLTALYAERIKANQKLVAAAKEALRNWRQSKQAENERIFEVLDLCAEKPEGKEKLKPGKTKHHGASETRNLNDKQPTPEPLPAAMAAAAGANGSGTSRMAKKGSTAAKTNEAARAQER